MKNNKLFCLLISLIVSFTMMAQTTVSGSVVDEMEEPLIGASVRIVNTETGTITDFNGAFVLDNVADDAIIEVSYMGYLPEEFRAESLEFRGVIQLKPDVQKLEEVIVVGYGASKIKDLTSPIEVVKGEKISAVPTSSAMSALQGQVAGVNIVNSGAPGSSPIVTIRGLGSFLSNAPLYVVDGMFYDDISFLNNNDIEEISVMKDASAAAIYGVRAANGVVIITTKHGSKNQRPNVTYDGYVGVQTAMNLLPMCSSNEYAELLMEADPSAYKTRFNKSMDVYGGTYDAQTGKYNLNQNTDWYQQLLRPAVITNHSLNITGGSDKATYGVGMSYIYQNGIMNTKNDYNKMTFHGNVEYSPFKWLTVGFNGLFSNNNIQHPNNAAWQQAFNMPGIFPVYDEATKTEQNYGYASPTTVGLGANFYNPVATAKIYDNQTKNNQLLANVFAQFNIWDNRFQLRTSYSYNYKGTQDINYMPAYKISNFQKNATSSLYKRMATNNDWIWDNTLTFADQWDKHAFKAMLGLSLREERFSYMDATGQNVSEGKESYKYINLSDASSRIVSDGGSRYRTFSYFGRVSYSYDDRYMIMATVRRDGSSKYNEKWGTFPSVGLAWTISNEPWAKGHKNFDYLKLRASWGLLGNDKIAPSYGSTQSDPQTAIFGTNTELNGYINTSTFSWLSWEMVNETNVGTSFGFFGNRLTGDLDWYYRLTQNAVCYPKVPMQDLTIAGNWATILNTGVDLNLRWEHKVNKDWTYFIGGNVGYLHNEVKSLRDNIKQIKDNGKVVQKVGEKMNSFYGLKVIGVYQNEDEVKNDPIAVANGLAPGDFKYEDVNNDGNINSEDMQILGSYVPDVTYGINLGFKYKGLDFSILFAGQAGGELWNRKRALRYACSSYNFDKNQYDTRWHGEGTSNTTPSAAGLMKAWNVGDSQDASYFVESSDYFRIQNITLGYSFTNVGVGTYKMPCIRLALIADKPFTTFKANSMTPELTDAYGWDTEVYPITATWSFSVQLKF